MVSTTIDVDWLSNSSGRALVPVSPCFAIPSMRRAKQLLGTAASIIALWTTIAITLLWFRQKSLLDLWLMVVMLVFMTEVLISSFPVLARFSAGMPGAPQPAVRQSHSLSLCTAV
jgi:hypothetical protein